jgi:hypothetical protein
VGYQHTTIRWFFLRTQNISLERNNRKHCCISFFGGGRAIGNDSVANEADRVKVCAFFVNGYQPFLTTDSDSTSQNPCFMTPTLRFLKVGLELYLSAPTISQPTAPQPAWCAL